MSSFSHDKSEDKPSKRNLIVGYSVAIVCIVLVLGFLIYVGVGELNYPS